MWWRWCRAALLLLSLPAPPAGHASAASPRPCRANPLCLCHADHFSCSDVPFHRLPEIGMIIPSLGL